MSKIFLCVSFADKEQAKKLGAKWDGDVKRWYCEKMTTELDIYKPVEVSIKYEDKDIYKKKFPSLYWDRTIKEWYMSKDDYSSFVD
jgi:Domain of unknown function (DUF5710)